MFLWPHPAKTQRNASCSLQAGETFGVAESVKAASDVYCPCSGEVVEVNKKLEAEPSLLNESPEDKGWMMKLKVDNPAQLKDLMNADAYAAYADSLDH